MRLRPVGVLTLWVALTAVLTTTAWLAVEVVADEVGGSQQRVLSAAAVASSANAVPQPAPSAKPSKTPKPAASPSNGPSKKPASSPRATPAASPKSSSSSSPKPTASHSAKPTPKPKPKPSSPPAGGGSVSKTFAVQGGTIAAACSGSAVSLKSAQPQNGWQVEVHDRGPQSLEITFRSGEKETEARIRCSGGVPVLSTDGESDD
jgi:outer membrane biosynthesis protein TonB